MLTLSGSSAEEKAVNVLSLGRGMLFKSDIRLWKIASTLVEMFRGLVLGVK